MFSWAFLAVCGLILGAGLARLAAGPLRRSLAGGAGRLAVDLLLPLTLVPVALYAVHPYLGNFLVGAGDSYHYGLQVADFITQMRAGVMPVLAGQSDYAFNGNIHTLRTAPYFTHFAGLLDLLTLRRLGFVELQNLTVVVTSVLAAWAAYGVARSASGGLRIAAWLLAAIYVLSPAIMGPLALHDMFATYMAAPWLVLCWHGLLGILQRGDDRFAQLLAAGALGVAWYAHSPIAAWLSLIWAAVLGLRALLAGGTAAQWLNFLRAGLLLAGLAAAVWVSVATLGPGPRSAANYDAFAFTWERLQAALRTEFSPFAAAPNRAGIQLGWALWLLGAVAAALFLWRRNRAGLLLGGLIALLLMLLLPLPHVSEFLWRLLPEKLVTLTNWPPQRIDPLLAAAGVAGVAMALRQLAEHRAARWSMVALLLAGAAWSIHEAHALHRRGGVARLEPDVHAGLFSRENLRLTRYSYALFERPPGYFTHGWADPEFESRLLSPYMDVVEDNSQAVLAAAPAAPFNPLGEATTLELAGPGEYLLAFAFVDTVSPGELTIRSETILRAYTLPRSGERLAFGAEESCAKTVPLRLEKSGKNLVTLASNVPGISYRVLPVDRSALPVRLDGQTPYIATVRARGTGFLETPRVYMSGYTAEVNGRPATVRRSPNDLAMIPVPAGESRVVLHYPGPASLRLAWFISLGCIAAWPWLLARNRGLRAGNDEASLFSGLSRTWRHQRKRVLLVFGLSLAVGAALWSGHRLWVQIRAHGALHLRLEFPVKPTQKAEPLLTLGRTGAADCIYVIYDSPGHIRLGLDRWGYGGPISAPIPIDPLKPHELEIVIGGLYPPAAWLGRSGPPDENAGSARFRVVLDDRVVFDEVRPYYPAAPAEVAIGRNPVGSSVAGEYFTGTILSAERSAR